MLDGFFYAVYAGLFYKLFIYAAAGLLICIVIMTIVCLINNKKIKRELQKENEDAEQK